MQVRNVAEAHRHAARGRDERDLAEVVERLQIARCAHHVFSLAELEHRAAFFLIRSLNRGDDAALRQVVGAQPVGIEHDLVLLHHAADRRDLRDVRHRFELVLQEPILKRAQLREVVPAAAIDERVFVDPADACRVRAERGDGVLRQARLHLVQVLEHARARPIEVRAVVEQHVDERVAEERVAAHRLRARHRQHRRRERVGDLVLDDLRRLARVRGPDDHLHVGQIR